MQPDSLRIDRHPRSRARKSWASPQQPAGWQPPGHRSRGRAALPATPTPAPERRAAAAGRCTPRQSRGTLKDGRRRPETCGGCSTEGKAGELHQQQALLVPWILTRQDMAACSTREHPRNRWAKHATPKAFDLRHADRRPSPTPPRETAWTHRSFSAWLRQETAGTEAFLKLF